MRAALADQPALVRNPAAIRPWQHVLNLLSGYLLLAESLWEQRALAQGWNFGPDELDARPVGWVVKRLAELWGKGLDWHDDAETDAVHEASYLKLDSSKARAELGWGPTWDLDAGLRAVADWYEGYREGGDMHAATLDRVMTFAAACDGQRNVGT